MSARAPCARPAPRCATPWLDSPISVSVSLPLVEAYGQALAALADPTRREIFERLAAGPRAVGELAAELPVSRPAVSQHLKVLKGAGLVSDRAEGTRRLYAVDRDGLWAIRRWLDGFWDSALASYKAAVERDDDRREQ
jgi:DNA-binding transcriptional ArsR family regulator